MDQQLGFCTTPDGVRVCYATSGAGTPLVKAPNWLGHLEIEKHSPVWRHWWEELAKDHLLVRLDQRGCGLSDWVVEDLSFEGRVRDLETVVDAAGLDRFILLGISQGGAAAIEFATRHPERVSHLVLYGAYARGSIKRGQPVEEHEALMTLMRLGWGKDNPSYRHIFTSQFLPEATTEQMRWFDELQRLSTSPDNAVRTSIVSGKIDVLDRLSQVTAPTLVLHARNDARVPFEEGQQLASLIPNSSFVPLDSKNHLMLETEPAWKVFLSEVRQFLGVQRGRWVASVPSRSCMGAIFPPLSTTAASSPKPEQVDQQSSERSNYPNGLTKREVEVVRLIAQGQSNKEIAGELIISLYTVAHHVSNILSKTGSSNRAGVATYATQNGLFLAL